MYSWPNSFSTWTDVAIVRGARVPGPGCIWQFPHVSEPIFSAMRFGPRIPRNLHSASQRLPRPFLLSIADTARHSLTPTTVPAYNRLYNSSLTSAPTSSANADSNVITQRLPSNSSQSTPMHEYNKLVEAGKLRSDDYQTQIIQKLQTLHDALALYDPPPSAAPPSLVRISPLSLSPHTQLSFTPLALAHFLPFRTERCEPRQTEGVISLR